MNRYFIILMMLFAGVLGGCASGDLDPRTGGLFGGISGISSGTYENRVKEKEARLEQLRATQSQLNIEKGQLSQQQSAAYAQLGKDQAQVSAMQSEIVKLEKSSKALATQQGTDQQRVTELQKRITGLKGNMKKQASALDALEGSGLGDADVDLRRKQLEKQRDDMAREYELLMKMQVELAQ
jgi:chromosome segregation ATPase